MATTTAAVIQWLSSGADDKAKATIVGLKEPNAVARTLAKELKLGGQDAVAQAQVAQWGAWTSTQTEGFGAEAAELNQVLASRSFLAGQALSLADVLVYWAIAHGVDQTLPGPVSGCPHLLRWFNHVQHALRSAAFAAHDAGLLPKLLTVQGIYKPISMPVFAKESAGAAGGGAKPAAAPQQQQQQAQGKGKENKAEQQQKQKQPPKEGGKGDGQKGAATDGQKGAATGGEGKKGGAAPAPAAEEEDLENPNHLNMRVGKIIKAWPHPESTKLWCEEIDLGEEAPRQIASGLREFYANASDLEGRMVLVLANLKPRKLAGFPSAGMVLCASNDAHTEVVFVDVPASAKVGDRIVFQGEGIGPVVEPMDPNKLAKKKVFEKIAPGLQTDAKGVCNFKGAGFTIEGSTEVCTAPLPNAHVS